MHGEKLMRRFPLQVGVQRCDADEKEHDKGEDFTLPPCVRVCL